MDDQNSLLTAKFRAQEVLMAAYDLKLAEASKAYNEAQDRAMSQFKGRKAQIAAAGTVAEIDAILFHEGE